MDEKPLISVIIPVYKVENYLDRCLESIVNQTFQNIEIIIVDDGSPDSCSEMCDVWAKKDSRIHIIHKGNAGLSDARNVGMKTARGEFISFIDSDDWIGLALYEKLIDVIQKDGSDIAACTVKMVWEDGTPEHLLTVKTNRVLNREEAQESLLKESLLKQPVWYKLYRSKLIFNIPFEVGKYHEDIFWSYQAVGMANKVSIIDYVGYYYWQRSASIMGEKYSLKRLDAVEGKARRQAYFEKTFPQLVSLGRIDIQGTCLYHGQKTLVNLMSEEKSYALSCLEEKSKKFRLTRNDLARQKWTHRCWFIIERVNFKLCCRLRNALKVGT